MAPAEESVDADVDDDRAQRGGPGEKPLSPKGIAVIATYQIAVALGLLVGLYLAWTADAKLRAQQEAPVKAQAEFIDPNHGPIDGGTAVKVVIAKPVQEGMKLRFDGIEMPTDVIPDTKILRASTPKHDAGRVLVDVMSEGKALATLSYTYGSIYNPWLFLLVLLAGGVGGSLHALRSLYWYVGNRQLVSSWILMYLLLPWTGALMAAIFYLVVSAGLMTTAQSSNPLIAVGMAAIVGMFSREAAEKLKSIADAFFTKASIGSDHVKPKLADAEVDLAILGVTPATGKTAGQEKVTITGQGFTGSPEVTFGNVPAISVKLESATALTALTPPHEKGVVDIVVKVGQKSVKSTGAFTYDD